MDVQRLRITFAKRGAIKYSSHLDLARAWERSLRRAGVPLAYSGGFNPRPKLQLASALPLGHSGEEELLDLWLERPMEVERFAGALVPVLPQGLTLGQVQPVPLDEPALPTQVLSVEYQVTVEWPLDGGPDLTAGESATAWVEARIGQALAMEELPHERRGRRYDLRPLIERLWLEEAGGSRVVLGMQLAARPGATGRPEAVLDVLGMGDTFARYCRRRLLLQIGTEPT